MLEIKKYIKCHHTLYNATVPFVEKLSMTSLNQMSTRGTNVWIPDVILVGKSAGLEDVK